MPSPEPTEPVKPPRLLDLDANGIPDYQEPAFWKALWFIGSALIRAFAPPHTLARRGVDAVDDGIRRSENR